MKKLFFEQAFIDGRFEPNVAVTIDDHVITDIELNFEGARQDATNDVMQVPGIALPGMTNVHSHAFQRAFAGLSEYKTAEHDSFWTWRQLMYQFVETLTPDDVYNIALELYTQLMSFGYTSVGEFHYLHHQPDGQHYQTLSAMSDAVVLAAIDSGISICALPVYYQLGGFDNSQLSGGQKRFGCDQETYLQLLDQLLEKWGSSSHVNFGVAIHSLRAVSLLSITRLLKEVNKRLPDCPIHIHIAEQTAEVDDCLAAHHKRPVELLMKSFDVGPRWCLIHATHMTENEISQVAKSGAVVGVCPTTEANLGDGIFAAEEYTQLGGRFAIGSDSHVCLDPFSELRLLEYGQRLTKRRRAVLGSPEISTGRFLYEQAAAGGAQALGMGQGRIAVGEPVRITMIDDCHPTVLQPDSDRWLDGLVFNQCGAAVERVIIGENIRHVKQ